MSPCARLLSWLPLIRPPLLLPESSALTSLSSPSRSEKSLRGNGDTVSFPALACGSVRTGLPQSDSLQVVHWLGRSRSADVPQRRHMGGSGGKDDEVLLSGSSAQLPGKLRPNSRCHAHHIISCPVLFPPPLARPPTLARTTGVHTASPASRRPELGSKRRPERLMAEAKTSEGLWPDDETSGDWQPVCKFFKRSKGTCRFGAACTFRHQMAGEPLSSRADWDFMANSDCGSRAQDSDVSVKLCTAWINTGRCPRMSACKFRHGTCGVEIGKARARDCRTSPAACLTALDPG